MSNSDKNVVKDFGEEWNKYPQDSIGDTQLKKAYDQYFNIFPFDQLPAQRFLPRQLHPVRFLRQCPQD